MKDISIDGHEKKKTGWPSSKKMRLTNIHSNLHFLYFFTLSENKFYVNNNNWCATEQTYMQPPLTVTALKCAIFLMLIFFSWDNMKKQL